MMKPVILKRGYKSLSQAALTSFTENVFTRMSSKPEYQAFSADVEVLGQQRTNVNGSCLIRQQYRFTYDYANRLLTANHFTHNGTAWVNTNNYSESNIAYDLNGNIKTYNRQGQTKLGTFGVIDQLTYTYGDAARPDRLTNVSDAGSALPRASNSPQEPQPINTI